MSDQFIIDKPYSIEYLTGYMPTTSIIFCDYTRTVNIYQNGIRYSASIGYCGRDLKNTRMKYLFIDHKIYNLEDWAPDSIFSDMDKLLAWLKY